LRIAPGALVRLRVVYEHERRSGNAALHALDHTPQIASDRSGHDNATASVAFYVGQNELILEELEIAWLPLVYLAVGLPWVTANECDWQASVGEVLNEEIAKREIVNDNLQDPLGVRICCPHNHAELMVPVEYSPFHGRYEHGRLSVAPRHGYGKLPA